MFQRLCYGLLRYVLTQSSSPLILLFLHLLYRTLLLQFWFDDSCTLRLLVSFGIFSKFLERNRSKDLPSLCGPPTGLHPPAPSYRSFGRRLFVFPSLFVAGNTRRTIESIVSSESSQSYTTVPSDDLYCIYSPSLLQS